MMYGRGGGWFEGVMYVVFMIGLPLAMLVAAALAIFFVVDWSIDLLSRTTWCTSPNRPPTTPPDASTDRTGS